MRHIPKGAGVVVAAAMEETVVEQRFAGRKGSFSLLLLLLHRLNGKAHRQSCHASSFFLSLFFHGKKNNRERGREK